MPIQAWPFHFDFINSLKSVFEDANKLFQLGGVQMESERGF
jgi:hypothetical protein